MITYILGGVCKSHMQIISSLGSVPVGRERGQQRLEGVVSVEPQEGLMCRVWGRTDTRARDRWPSYSWASERGTWLADLGRGEKRLS